MVPEELDQLGGLCRRGRPVGEAEAPDGQERAAAVVQVAAAPGHAQRVHQVDPVALDVVHERGAPMPGDVVHHGKDPAVSFGRGLHVARDPVAKAANGGVVQACGEALQEHPGEVVVPHPLEVPGDGRGPERREDLGAPAVGQCQRRGAALAGGKLGHVRPHVHAHRRGTGRRTGAEPVFPAAERRPVIRTAEPSLIAEQQLVVDGGGVHRGRRADGGERYLLLGRRCAGRRQRGAAAGERCGRQRRGEGRPLPGPVDAHTYRRFFGARAAASLKARRDRSASAARPSFLYTWASR